MRQFISKPHTGRKAKLVMVFVNQRLLNLTKRDEMNFSQKRDVEGAISAFFHPAPERLIMDEQ